MNFECEALLYQKYLKGFCTFVDIRTHLKICIHIHKISV